MNIKKIIREEIEDFDWVGDVPDWDMTKDSIMWIGSNPELLNKVLAKLYSLGFSWASHQNEYLLGDELGYILGSEDLKDVVGLAWRGDEDRKGKNRLFYTPKSIVMYFRPEQRDSFEFERDKGMQVVTPEQLLK